MTDLTTRYLGLTLRNPVVASASPLGQSVEGVKALADAGVGAVVLPSLFEEEVQREELHDLMVTQAHEDAFGEARSYLPEPEGEGTGAATRHLRMLEKAAAAVDVPVIASLNGGTSGTWVSIARAMQEAGAAAIELNVFVVPGISVTARRVEKMHLELLGMARSAVDIPVSVKLSPYFSATGEMAVRLDMAGADGLVMFNRFVLPDIDPETLTVLPTLGLSRPAEARLARTWISLLAGRVEASLAASTGVDQAGDVVAYLLAGADVVMTASALLRHGVGHATTLVEGLEDWLRRHGARSVEEIRGRLAVPVDVDDTALQRAGYVQVLSQAKRTYATGAHGSAQPRTSST